MLCVLQETGWPLMTSVFLKEHSRVEVRDASFGRL